jgi:2'-5' RNA ligase
VGVDHALAKLDGPGSVLIVARLFGGLWLSAAMQREVTEWMRLAGRQNAGFKWTPPGNLHFTLKFFGDVPAGEIDRLVRVLSESTQGQKVFRLRLGRPGLFPDRERPRIVWLGVSQGEAQLRALAGAVEAGSVQAGFAAARQRFQPHLTVARALAAQQPLLSLSPQTAFDSETEVDSFSLIESTLRSPGPLYRSIADFRLETVFS